MEVAEGGRKHRHLAQDASLVHFEPVLKVLNAQKLKEHSVEMTTKHTEWSEVGLGEPAMAPAQVSQSRLHPPQQMLAVCSGVLQEDGRK